MRLFSLSPCVSDLLSQQDAGGVERPVDLVGQVTLQGEDGVVGLPQVPRLDEAVFSRRHNQEPERGRTETDISYLKAVKKQLNLNKDEP